MIDESPPGAWRAALNAEGLACAVCHQNVCDHSDLAYQGVVSGTATPPARATARTQGGEGTATYPAAVPASHLGSQFPHASTSSPEAQHDHVI